MANIKNLYNKAFDLYSSGQIHISKEIFSDIILKDSTHHQSINMLGLIANLEGDINSSSKYIKQAVDLVPTNSNYLNNLGILYLNNNDLDEALKIFYKAIKYGSENSDAYSNAGYTQYKRGIFEEAKVLFEKALKYNPSNLSAYMHGASLFRDMNNRSSALGYYERVIHIEPTYIEAYLQRANIYFELGIYNEALADYQKVIQLDPSLIDDNFLKGTINRIFTKLFPSNRFSFYNNKYKVEQYQKALKNIISSTTTVLEYSNVEGLLSLMSAKENVKNITLVIEEPFMALQATELITKNNLSNKINIINKNSSNLILEEDIDQKVDLLIVDLFNSGFPQFRDLLTAQNLKNNFLKTDGVIFPKALKLMIAPIFSEELFQEQTASNTAKLDISTLNDFRPFYIYERLEHFSYEILSEVVEIYQFDLNAYPKNMWEKEIQCLIEKDSLCHGVVVWLDQHLDETCIVDNAPKKQKNSYQFIHLFDYQQKCIKDDILKLNISYSDFPIVSIIKEKK